MVYHMPMILLPFNGPTCRLSAIMLAAILSLSASPAPIAASEAVALRGQRWSVAIEPRTLRVTGTPTGETPLMISADLPMAAAISDLHYDDRQVSWRLIKEDIAVAMRLENDALIVKFTADRPGTFTWPVNGPDPLCRAYILPMFEGLFVPADDAEWSDFLKKQGPLNTTADFSMPFWGIDAGAHTVTYIATNPFNNEVSFGPENGRLTARFSHEFTPNHQVKEYGMRICLGDAAPIEPARIYRRYVIDRGEFVNMRQKIQQTPDVARLLGAAHVYLWGEGLISGNDFSNPRKLAERITEQAAAPGQSPGKRIWARLSPELRKVLCELPTKQWVDHYDKGQVAEALSGIMEQRDFYDAASWKEASLPAQAASLSKQGLPALNHEQLYRLNRLVLYAAFPDCFNDVDTWGDGLSPGMLQRFADAGLDRLWLGSPDWTGLTHWPDTTRKAIALGYLIGPYDSFNAIHSPDETNTWETAQFDRKLYEQGPIVNRDGSRKKGFGQKGFALSPIAARPAVEARVTLLMGQFQCNSWFVDCDAFGDLSDDYSPLHPGTQEDDMNARLSRMAWVRDTFKAVIGSEGGSAYAAGTIHFAHGTMTPGIGWGDADLKDRNSPYYLGAYYPPDGPTVFMKQVPMKPQYRRTYADPRFRLPLYEIVFHDSVVATHQWGFGSYKFVDETCARELLELLYNVPPLYHMNRAEWERRKDAITAHYAFFSLLHREAALLPMTDFRWLDETRQTQRTVFGDKIQLVANFGDASIEYQHTAVPPRSILAKWIESGKTVLYSPGEAAR
jgi:hypothetical protein